MWALIRRAFLGRREAGSITLVDEFIREGGSTVSTAVTGQLAQAKPTGPQLAVMRSFMLGYIATLSEQLCLASGRSDAASLVAVLAAETALDPKANAVDLLEEFMRYSSQREVGFGQGGAVALRDAASLVSGGACSGILPYFKGSAVK